MDRRERDQHLHRRAVRVGDDAARAVAHRVRVHFRDHQRDVVVVAEGRGVVDHHRAGGGELRRVFRRRRCRRRRTARCPRPPNRRSRGPARRCRYGRISTLRAGRALARERDEFADGELALAPGWTACVSPTAPVAPTMATLNFLVMDRDSGFVEQTSSARKVLCRLSVFLRRVRCAARRRRRRRIARDGARPGPSAPAPPSPRDRRGAHADAGIVAACVDHFDRLAVEVQAARRQAQAGGRLERRRHARPAARSRCPRGCRRRGWRGSPSGVISSRCALPLLRDDRETVADFDALDRVDAHQRARRARRRACRRWARPSPAARRRRST